MNYLINELLTFSKIEMKQMRISVRKGDIMHFLEELSHIFDIVAGEREIDSSSIWKTPKRKSGSRLPSWNGFLYNLLSNAI